jgi:hypothetical protein
VVAITWSVDGHTIWTACADRTLRSFRAPTAVPTDPELASVWIHVHTGYGFSLPKAPAGEVPLEKLTLLRSQGSVSAPSIGTDEKWWRKQRERLDAASLK